MMLAVVETATGRVPYLFAAGAAATLDGRGLHGPVRALDIRPATHALLTVPAPPGLFVGNAWTYREGGGDDAGWQIADQAALDARAAELLDTARAAKRDAVQAEADRRMNAGYAHDFGPPHGLLTLQTREPDRTNWLTVAQIARLRVDAEEPDFAMRPIRTAENVNVPITAAAALACMVAQQAHLGAVLEQSWALKDAIAAAPDQAALDAIDPTTGWPA